MFSNNSLLYLSKYQVRYNNMCCMYCDPPEGMCSRFSYAYQLLKIGVLVFDSRRELEFFS
jgi:hypothetical protein